MYWTVEEWLDVSVLHSSPQDSGIISRQKKFSVVYSNKSQTSLCKWKSINSQPLFGHQCVAFVVVCTTWKNTWKIPLAFCKAPAFCLLQTSGKGRKPEKRWEDWHWWSTRRVCCVITYLSGVVNLLSWCKMSATARRLLVGSANLPAGVRVMKEKSLKLTVIFFFLSFGHHGYLILRLPLVPFPVASLW